MTKKRKDWRPFEEAREFVLGLGLKGRPEWREWTKSGKKPADIPSSPQHVYKEEWSGFGDWLGTGRRKTKPESTSHCVPLQGTYPTSTHLIIYDHKGFSTPSF